jgi:hypothetical protein
MCMKKALMHCSHVPRHQRLGKPRQWPGILGACLLLWLSACTFAPAQSQPPANLGPTPTPDFHLRDTAITIRQTLAAYEQLIAQAQTYGHDVSLDQQQLAQDYQDFDSAHTTQAYQALTARIQAQMSRLRKAMLPEKTRYDLHQLQKLIGETNINNDYEYRDADDALLVLQSRLQWAKTTSDYQQIDHQAQILLTNLRALLANLTDKTSHKQAHVTDLQLIDAYHLTGKVIIVSLTEQTLRMYHNGQFVGWMYVVTGQRAMQTPPGLWHILTKETNLTFSAPPTEDPNSPLWYPPTHINYGLKFKEWSYYLHDATWRSYFGPGANLPHDDYTSGKYSVNGTHGCINMSLDDTRRLYTWAEVGIPVVVY